MSSHCWLQGQTLALASMTGKACTQGFLTAGTDVSPIVPALEKIWTDSMGKGLAEFNFRTVTSKFNDLVYEYPIRIPERYALVIRCCLLYQALRSTQLPP